jgi:hypothetical protein
MWHPAARLPWYRVGAALAAACLSGCHHPSVSKPTTAVACPPAVAPQPNWQPVNLAAFTMRIPPKFARDTVFRCFHGGETYSDGTSQLGYCSGRYGPIAATNAPHEQRILFLGAPALLRCDRYKGVWSASIVSIGSDIQLAADALTNDKARLGLLIGILENATLPQP